MQSKKIFLTFLNTLLVIGAILSIATIDQGRWLVDYLIYLSSGEVGENLTPIQNTHANETEEKPSYKLQGACIVKNQFADPQWYVTYLLVSQYNKAYHGRTQSGSGVETTVICGS